MTIYNIAGMYYVLDRARLTVTRDRNRMRAIHNALMKTYLYDIISEKVLKNTGRI